ncbi:DUF7660 family protein [Micromonospora inositola]|uniref:DUF7660 domain-containing protein n=2 Tax=Micromonospora inositola TaxID=47865 RepID=A0A1C5IV20_9ACTN|nr:hypothetical protein GA0070613_3502 [Micromonospora inositola]
MYETGGATHAESAGVSSRDEFAAFMEAVLRDYRQGGDAEWENGTLDRFLDALAAFAGARVNGHDDQETPTWRLFAEMIVAATGYE